MNTTETKVELVVRAGDEWWFGSDDGKEGVILDASNHNRAIAVGGCDNAEERDRLEFMVKAYNACAGIADPQSAIAAAREALKDSVKAAEYVVRLIEQTGKAGVSPNPMEKADWLGAAMHCYAAMSFIQKARQALERLG
jgi:hypothetical protein